MAFNAMWKPGPEAVAGIQRAGSGNPPALVIYLDPDSLAILPPADRAKWPEFIRLLNEVCEGAAELALHLAGTASGPSSPYAADPIGDAGGR